ncbi:winged helix-turn-helix domain-containing protein [Nonomuraea angiospora]|uniref:winged helix-turn-helix domain-containing protein n=1 Tax=Nonomuraea angiospora TaxID=46172 RepID=UPI0029AA8CA6|nr:winged helix-turn-helix domain-containing protein [Nonomuraea angiospora]
MAAEPPVRLDPIARRVWLNGTPVHLARLCFELLAYLAASPGRAIPRAELMREIWGFDWKTSSKTLDMHVSWLRRHLGDDASNPRYITTVRGVGIRLEPDTVELATPAAGPDMSGTRVMLVKPGDVLVFGNVGEVGERIAATANSLRDQLGLRQVVLFQDDIDMTALPGSAP